MRRGTLFGMGLLVAALSACNGATKGPDPTPTVATPTPPPAPPPAPNSALGWIADWASPSCGDRSYVRWISLAADGTVTGQERVSPCPPNVACVWSGIIAWKGTWTERSGSITLAVDLPAGAPTASKPIPTELYWNGAALVEKSASTPCNYERRKPENEGS